MKNAAKVKKVGKHRSLVKQLRTPIDSGGHVISQYHGISNIGLRIMSDKLDAIGEALAYLIEKKHMKIRVKKRGG